MSERAITRRWVSQVCPKVPRSVSKVPRSQTMGVQGAPRCPMGVQGAQVQGAQVRTRLERELGLSVLLAEFAAAARIWLVASALSHCE